MKVTEHIVKIFGPNTDPATMRSQPLRCTPVKYRSKIEIQVDGKTVYSDFREVPTK